jgi:hypothetical protein
MKRKRRKKHTIVGHDTAAAGRARLGKFKVTDYEAVRKYRVYHLQCNLQAQDNVSKKKIRGNRARDFQRGRSFRLSELFDTRNVTCRKNLVCPVFCCLIRNFLVRVRNDTFFKNSIKRFRCEVMFENEHTICS